MNNKLLITKLDNRIVSAFFRDMELIQVSINKPREEEILDNVYLGKVQNIVTNIKAAFIEIADGRVCYYSINENQYPIMSNSYTDEQEKTKLKIGDELIVQVTREGVKSKAPVVSSNVNITGKYVALTHGKNKLGVSKKITDSKERTRLRRIAKQFANKNYGFVFRTNSADISEEKIVSEINKLIKIYDEIRTYGVHKNRFSLIYEAPAAYICDIRDGYSEKVDEFITDDKELYDKMKGYLEHYQPEDLPKLRFYDDKMISLANLYGLRSKIEEATKPLVWLKSGGSLVIQPTEALTVIDVNTGKAVSGKKKVQETFLKVNLEAAKEIAKQIRLRNISGIIIIDFIDMELEKHKELLMETLNSYLKKDPIKTNLVDMTALGLVEVTRKKVRKPLHEQVKEG